MRDEYHVMVSQAYGSGTDSNALMHQARLFTTVRELHQKLKGVPSQCDNCLAKMKEFGGSVLHVKMVKACEEAHRVVEQVGEEIEKYCG